MTVTEPSTEREEMWSTFFDDNHTIGAIPSRARFHRTFPTGPKAQLHQKNIAIDTVDFLILNPRPS